MTAFLSLPSAGMFWGEVWTRALHETWHLLSPRVSSIAIALGLNLVAIVLYAASKKGFGDSVNDKLHFFLMVLAANVVAAILILFINLGRAPYLLYRDQAAKLDQSGQRERDALSGKVAAEKQRDAKQSKDCKKQECPTTPKSDGGSAQQKITQTGAAPAPTPEIAPIFLTSVQYPQSKSVMEAVSAFLYLHPQLSGQLGEPGKECSVRITAPKENNEVWLILRNLAFIGRCHVDGRPSDDLKPEIETEALDGAIKDAVIVHAPNDVRYNNAAMFLSRLLKIIRKYDMWNEGKPDQEVWIQIGPGIPYKQQSDFATTIK